MYNMYTMYNMYILGPGELGFSCSRQLGYPWGGLLTLVLPRLKLYFFNGSSRDVIGVTYASRSYLMFFPNIHKEPQVTHHANFKSRERHDRADYMSQEKNLKLTSLVPISNCTSLDFFLANLAQGHMSQDKLLKLIRLLPISCASVILTEFCIDCLKHQP